MRSVRCRGYSLLELVLAISIFSVGVVGAMELFGGGLRSSAASSDYTQAVFLAQGLVEGTLAEGFFTADSDSGDFGADHPKHSWTLDVEETDTEGLYAVTATVTWQEAGVDKAYTLTTLAAERS